MKAAVELNAHTRTDAGKGSARAARRADTTPVNVYAKGKANLSLVVDTNSISKEYFKGGFKSKVVALNVAGTTHFAIPCDVQLNPVSDKIEHVDFLAVDETSVVKVLVPIHFVNADKSIGIKRGGILNVVSHEVLLNCPVNAIPKHIEIDLATVNIGTSIQVSDLSLAEGVSSAVKGREVTIASIAGRAKDEEAEAAPAAAAAGKGAAKPAAKK